MRADLLIPFVYTARRDVHLLGCGLATSFCNPLKNTILVYLWVPAYALLLSGAWGEASIYLQLLGHFLGFLAVYEVGYIVTDQIGYRFEDRTVRTAVYPTQPSMPLVALGVVSRITALVLFAALAGVTSQTALPYLTMLAVFILHAFATERFRIATFLSLRVLKGYVPFAFLLVDLPEEARLFVFAALVGSAVFYSIEYYLKKLGNELRIDILSIRNYSIKLSVMIALAVSAWTFTDAPLGQLAGFVAVLLLHHGLYIGIRLTAVLAFR